VIIEQPESDEDAFLSSMIANFSRVLQRYMSELTFRINPEITTMVERIAHQTSRTKSGA